MRMFLEDEIGNSSGMNDGRGRMKTNGSNWKRAWALLLMIFVLAAPLAAQAPSQGEEVGLRLDVDKRQLEVGESLSLIIEFKQLVVGGNVISAEPNLPTPELFQARSSSTSTQVTIVNQKTAQVTTTHITLEAVKPGSETLGPASVIFQDPSGKRREITSNVINVTVTEKKGFSLFGGAKPTPLPEGNQPSSSQSDDALRGLKPLLPDPLLFLFKTGLLILILLLIVGFIAWKVWGSQKRAAKSGPPLGREGILREAWKKLANEDLSAEDFCRSLSSIIRECLEYQFEFSAVDYTTEEIFKELKNHEPTSKQMEAVEKCLKACDRVLYADGNLTGRENLRSLASSLLPKIQ